MQVSKEQYNNLPTHLQVLFHKKSDNLNGGAYSGGKRSEGDWKDNSGFKNDKLEEYKQPQGRFPANLILDGSDEVVELFPNTKSGNLNSGHKRGDGTGNSFMGGGGTVHGNYGGDSGSAARFFYCAKASKSERNMGCEGLEEKTAGECTDRKDGSAGLNSPRAGAGRTSGSRNNHPTVKPIALMEYLIKLVSREGHTILDPFMGSGSTGIACKNLKRHFIGIEREPDYIKISEARINNVKTQQKLI